MQCPTVKVVSGNSYAIINESDYDKSVHKLYVEPKRKASDSKAGTGEAVQIPTKDAVTGEAIPPAMKADNPGWGTPPPA